MPGVTEEEGPPSSTDATFRDPGGGQWGGWMCRIVNQCPFPHELALCVGGWAGAGAEGWISVPPSGALPGCPTRTAPPIHVRPRVNQAGFCRLFLVFFTAFWQSALSVIHIVFRMFTDAQEGR